MYFIVSVVSGLCFLLFSQENSGFIHGLGWQWAGVEPCFHKVNITNHNLKIDDHNPNNIIEKQTVLNFDTWLSKVFN